MLDLSFYKDKSVLITGHTGFKGTWLTKILVNAGAKVTGYSLEAPTNPNLFSLSKVENNINHIIGDVRDLEHLKEVFKEVQPEIVFHLAAQPIVRDSYKDPVYTYETNVMGTVNVLECARLNNCVKSVLNVTTDKVYLNKELDGYGYKETDELDGYDPYSNSKSCSELVTHSYKNSFFNDMDIAVSTARAGNVIGGGDFANDRIVPDCVRAIKNNEVIKVRNPYSTRPYQHVLDPLAVYLEIVEKQYNNHSLQGYYNVGPDDCDCVTTGNLVDLFCKYYGNEAKWENVSESNAPHEANFLKLDNSKIKEVFNWHPRWHIDECMKKTVEFSKIYLNDGDIPSEMDKEIKEFLNIK